MKRKKNGTTNPHQDSAKVVRLEFSHPTASTVTVAGTFNNWRPDAVPMVAVGKGRWFKELILPPGDYEYMLVADGQWLPDPHAAQTVPNPYGGVNSVMRVPNGS